MCEGGPPSGSSGHDPLPDPLRHIFLDVSPRTDPGESDPLKLRLPDFPAIIQNTIYKPSSLTTSVTAKGSSTPFPSGAIFAA